MHVVVRGTNVVIVKREEWGGVSGMRGKYGRKEYYGEEREGREGNNEEEE